MGFYYEKHNLKLKTNNSKSAVFRKTADFTTDLSAVIFTFISR